MTTLKAWQVDDDEWSMVVYAETRGKAKVVCIRELLDERDMADNLIALGCKRAASMDHFAGDEVRIEYDLGHYLAGGFNVACSRCETTVRPDDTHRVVGEDVFCEGCMRLLDQEAA